MSLTALTWLLGYCLLACLSFLNPLFGALGYLHEYYNRPELQWWGDELPALRWNLIISIILGVTFLVRRSSLRPLKSLKNLTVPWLLVLNATMIIVSAVLAVWPSESWDWTIQWTKTALIFPLLLIGVTRSRGAFNAIAAANVAGALWWGWDSWRDPKRQAGRLVGVGSGDTQDDNAAAAHLVTVLPLAVMFLLVEKDKRLRALGLVAVPFIINTIILCNSRSAVVAMVVAAGATMLLVRSQYRLKLGGVALAMGLAFFMLADEQFISRQQTTANYEEDNSAQQRLIAWRAGYELVKDHPLGTGGRGFHFLSPIYMPEIVAAYNGDLRGPHNTYVMVASEWGVIGLVAFIGYISATFVMLGRVKKRANGQDFYYWRALAVQVGFIAYLIASAFTARLYAEVGYWFSGLAFVLYRLQYTEIAEQANPVSEGTEIERTRDGIDRSAA